MGTASITMKGRTKLSYCAERVRYTTSVPSPNRIRVVLPELSSSSDKPVHWKVYPCGRTFWLNSAMASSACPELKPGAAEPSISAERNRL